MKAFIEFLFLKKSQLMKIWLLIFNIAINSSHFIFRVLLGCGGGASGGGGSGGGASGRVQAV